MKNTVLDLFRSSTSRAPAAGNVHRFARRLSRLSRLAALGALATFCMSGVQAHAETPTLAIKSGDAERRFTAAELLARPDAASVHAGGNGDIYHRAVEYRAVPLLALLGNRPEEHFDTVELQASDGFVSEIPLALVERGAHNGAIA